MRRGMIRCRECGRSTNDVNRDPELAGRVHQPNQDRRCPRCRSVLEPGMADCAVCTSRMLDQLLQGPALAGAHSPAPQRAEPRKMSVMEQRVRLAAQRDARAREAAMESDTIADASPTAVRPRRTASPTSNGASVTQPAMHSARSPSVPPKTQVPATRGDQPAAPAAVATVQPASPPSIPEPEEAEPPTVKVETSPACAALLASLAAADANLRCEIATALGKLGDKAALGPLGPLERHMGDKDIRVRRAVAAALVQLGHPKGNTLLGIAERMPASSVLMLAKPPANIRKRSSGGGSIDQPTLIKVGGGLLAAAVLGGGIWMWMNSAPSTRTKAKKGKAAAATKAAAAAKSKPSAAVQE